MAAKRHEDNVPSSPLAFLVVIGCEGRRKAILYIPASASLPERVRIASALDGPHKRVSVFGKKKASRTTFQTWDALSPHAPGGHRPM